MPRGGKRNGAGRKPKPLSQKIAEGNPGHRPLTKVEFSGSPDRPKPPDYLTLMVKHHLPIPSAVDFFNRTVDWLEPTGCMHMVPPENIANHALAKYFLTEAAYALNGTGMIGKNEKKMPVVSGFAKGFFEALKVTTATWETIYEVVAQNCVKRVEDPEKDWLKGMLTATARNK